MVVPTLNTVETRPVCPACGHIDGAHLDHCRIAELERELATAKMEAKTLQGFADLWYFAMDHAPGDFERIVTHCPPETWMHEIAKVRRGER